MGKARRRATASGDGGTSTGAAPGASTGAASAEEHKLYLEEAVLERRHSDVDLKQLVDLPNGLGYNEWLASHTVDFFQHINLIYGTISEFCTSTTCPEMVGPCHRQYVWTDERNRKVRTTAPQYIDYVMTFTQRTINNEALFPSRLANEFPNEFESVVRRVFQLLFHVIAHVYHNHFRELMLLTLHAHLNCIFAHFSLFNERFKLIDTRETEVLHDLAVALKLCSAATLSCQSTSSNASSSSHHPLPLSLPSLAASTQPTANDIYLPLLPLGGAGDDNKENTLTSVVASSVSASAGDSSVHGCAIADSAAKSGDNGVAMSVVASGGVSATH